MAYKAKQITEIERTTKALNDSWAEASQELYNNSNKDKKNNSSSSNKTSESANVQDIDFEEVK